MADAETRTLAAARVAGDLLADVNARVAEYRAIKTEVTALAKAAAQDRASAAALLSEITQRQAAIDAVIAANIPAHEWQGASLRLRNPDGTWGELVDLKGLTEPSKPGTPGRAATIEIASVELSDPDTPPQVINTGSPTAAVLHFILPALPVPTVPLPETPTTYHYLGF